MAKLVLNKLNLLALLLLTTQTACHKASHKYHEDCLRWTDLQNSMARGEPFGAGMLFCQDMHGYYNLGGDDNFSPALAAQFAPAWLSR